MEKKLIKTSGVKYIGSKEKLLEPIIKVIKELPLKRNKAIDVFTGTTRVAQALKKYNYLVYTSDLSWASECYSRTFICNENNEHLQKHIDLLNNIEPIEDWITKNYCDVIADNNIIRVWQRKNGMKADAIRNEIEKLKLKDWEKSTLITSLIFALDAVDNTCGVQQAYLKNWCKRSFNELKLILPKYISGEKGKHFVGNALKIEYPESDVAYLDPPYSSHSYATYYHIWDSITKWDKPEVLLKTNRRKDRTKNSFDENMFSEWNRKNMALKAMETLIEKLPVDYVVLSYNNEGIIEEAELFSFLKKYSFDLKEIKYRRNIMSSIGNATKYKKKFITKNKEYIIVIKK